MKHNRLLTIFFLTICFQVLAAKPKATVKGLQASTMKISDWNPACHGLLENSIATTLKLEQALKKKRKKLSQNSFNEKIQSELQVVQLNAWVCAVSSNQKLGASVEQEFLQEYARKIQQKNL